MDCMLAGLPPGVLGLSPRILPPFESYQPIIGAAAGANLRILRFRPQLLQEGPHDCGAPITRNAPWPPRWWAMACPTTVKPPNAPAPGPPHDCEAH